MPYGKRLASKPRLDVGSLNRKFKKFERGIRASARQLLAATGNSSASLEVYLVGGKTMDKNVLAFPAPKDFFRPDVANKFLGEIYLNPDYVEKHGENLTYMLVHGFLHLLGYDHIKKSDRMAMERREKVLMRQVRGPLTEGVFHE